MRHETIGAIFCGSGLAYYLGVLATIGQRRDSFPILVAFLLPPFCLIATPYFRGDKWLNYARFVTAMGYLVTGVLWVLARYDLFAVADGQAGRKWDGDLTMALVMLTLVGSSLVLVDQADDIVRRQWHDKFLTNVAARDRRA